MRLNRFSFSIGQEKYFEFVCFFVCNEMNLRERKKTHSRRGGDGDTICTPSLVNIERSSISECIYCRHVRIGDWAGQKSK